MDDDSKIFPQRLMEILSDEAAQEAISWLPHGRAFMVRDRQLFADQVMPRYFPRHAKYSSFTRKLNRWNFVRVSSGPEIGAYYHEFFLRDKPHLAAQMFCKNARTKLAMSNDTPLPSVNAKPAPEPLVQQREASPPAQPVLQLPPDIPLALLEALSKGPSLEPRQQQGPTGSLLLQQSQYANLLLERQIQILQREQAKLMLVKEAVALQNQREQELMQRKPSAQEDARLRQLLDIRSSRQPAQGRGPTNHRASAA